MNKHDLRVVKTKENLKNTLLTLLKEKPLEKIKVAEICRAANLNRGTFYLHYSIVEDIFKELFDQIIVHLDNSYREQHKKTSPLVMSNLDQEAIRIFHHIKTYQAFYEIVLSKNVSNSYYYMLFDKLRNNLQNNFIHEYRPEIKTDYLIGFHVNAMIGMILVWYQNKFIDSPEEMNKQLYFILKDLYSEKRTN